MIRRLYAVEREAQAAALDAPRRQARRAAASRPVLAVIEEQIATLTPTVLPDPFAYLRAEINEANITGPRVLITPTPHFADALGMPSNDWALTRRGPTPA